jgi:enolase
MALQEYIDQHELQKKVEHLINQCVAQKPDDPLSFMSNELRNMTAPEITDVKGRMVIDSRGNPTVEADVHTHKGFFRAAVPSGASTGIYEAVELRDGDKSVFMGKGVSKAVDNINKIIAPGLKGKNPIEQKEIDDIMIKELDGTKNKAKLGANAILAVSLAVCKAGAAEKNVPLWQHIADLAGNPKPCLPVPSFNIINGGSHAGNALAMQEFMILPVGAESFSQAMRMGCEVYHNLKALIKEKYGIDATNVGDEGGFAPNISSNDEGLSLVNKAIAKAGYEGKVKIGMDVAASEFYTEDKMYDLDFKNTKTNDGSHKKTGAQMTEMYKGFCKDFPVISIEDPFDQVRLCSSILLACCDCAALASCHVQHAASPRCCLTPPPCRTTGRRTRISTARTCARSSATTCS